MIKHLVILLSSNSTSFCYYSSNYVNSNNVHEDLIDFDLLRETIEHSIKNDIFINYIFGYKNIPLKYLKEINKSNHIKIIPLSLSYLFKDSIIVINPNELNSISQLKKNSSCILILRLAKDQLNSFSNIIKALIGKFKKLNLILLDLDKYSHSDILSYNHQLQELRDIIISSYNKTNIFEINFITDLWFLKSMNNCNAGINHITLAPNGCYYICPSYFYDSPENNIGQNISEVSILNKQLLDFEHAPICKQCNSYQCKRCYYLNKKTTLEINIPSFQQCQISHYERNFSRDVLNILSKESDYYKSFPSIESTDYMDPIELIGKFPNKNILINNKNC